MHPILAKEHQELPDSYGVMIYLITGKQEEFEIGSHYLSDKLFELHTKDDKIVWYPLSNIVKIEFDKRFSKIVEIKRKMEKK